MNYQQWQQIAQRMQQLGFSQQDIIGMIGQPPAQTWGGLYQMPTSGASPMGPAPAANYGYNASYSQGGGLDPLQQALIALVGPEAIRATKAPYDLQMQAARMGVNNPMAITAMINRATRQLSPQLIQSVTRGVTPNIAMRGLATSPGMSEQMVAEALAPYAQANQQMAQNQILAGLQAPYSVGSGLAGEYPSSMVDYATMIGARPSGY